MDFFFRIIAFIDTDHIEIRPPELHGPAHLLQNCMAQPILQVNTVSDDGLAPSGARALTDQILIAKGWVSG